MMDEPSDETIVAYVDGELDAQARAAFAATMAGDPALARRVEAHQALRRQLGQVFAGTLDEPMPEALLRALNPSAAVVDFAAAQAARRAAPSPRRWGGWMAVAASLAVGLVAGRLSLSQPAVGIASADGALVARGALGEALDEELASSGNTVGLSFKSRDGAYCRTFQARSFAGLACRDDEQWKVRVAVASAAPAADAGYRMATSPTPAAVLQAVDAIIVGQPLDAAAEAAARAAGWRAANNAPDGGL